MKKNMLRFMYDFYQTFSSIYLENYKNIDKISIKTIGQKVTILSSYEHYIDEILNFI